MTTPVPPTASGAGLSPLRILLGFVLGAAIGSLWVVAFIFVAFGLGGEELLDLALTVVFVGLGVLPVAAALSVVVSSSRRRRGRGLLLGVAVGILAVAATYVAVLLPELL